MNSTRRSGYTVVEVIVVIGIIGLLLGILLPAVQNVRAAAARTGCLNHMRQIGLALQNYESHQRRLPPVMVEFPPSGGKNFGAAVSWRAPLLPHLEQEALWAATLDASRQDPISYHNPPHTPNATVVKVFVCPADDRLSRALMDKETGIRGAYTSYMAVAGSFPGSKAHPEYAGVFGSHPYGTRLAEIRDGTSNTLAVGERPPPDSLENGWWYSMVCSYAGGALTGPCRGPAGELTIANPNTAFQDGCFGPFYYGPGRLNNPCDRFHFWSLHSGGANFAFADGSVRFLAYSANPIMPALATREGGEAVSVP